MSNGRIHGLILLATLAGGLYLLGSVLENTLDITAWSLPIYLKLAGVYLATAIGLYVGLKRRRVRLFPKERFPYRPTINLTKH